ncbi:MAG: methionine gamma-lyase family protein [Clostridia bacterium]|nr:methionine gamma-lyase family protein [Clostridia bacterium]
MEYYYKFDFSPELVRLADRVEEKLVPRFAEIDRISKINSQKVHYAFRSCAVSDTHFVGTTGYGYDDRGRTVIDRVYAAAFCAEDALVRHFMLSGTHALTTALFGILRPGDTMLSVAAKPYDTLDKVIGLRPTCGSLAEFGIRYAQVELNEAGRLDFDAIEQALASHPTMVYLQRSRGYAVRPSIFVDEIREVARLVKRVSPESVFFVDNCYGEFVELSEPIETGADLMAGSLIKNPGGSMAECGGYIVGREKLVQRCAYRLTTPGQGKDVGPSLGQNRNLLRGFYFAPSITGNALKTAVFAAALFEEMGFECSPRWNDPRTDIVEQVIFHRPEPLISFCQGIQSGSAIDSFVRPEPWAMPGYTNEVIMAAGAFVQGSSIELSADGPLREPYAAYMQGGIIYDTAQIGILSAAQKLLDDGLVEVRL